MCGLYEVSFLQQWQSTASLYQLLMVSVGQVPTAIVAAWIARGSDEKGIALVIAVGAAFVIVWNVCVFRTGFSLVDERWNATLELNLLSRSPLTLIMLGKSLAHVAFFGFIGLIALVSALLVAGHAVTIEEPLAFALSLVLAVLAVVALQFLFAPLSFLVGAQGGFFNAIMPLGVVLSGFFYPVSLLPTWAEWLARVSSQRHGRWRHSFGPWMATRAWPGSVSTGSSPPPSYSHSRPLRRSSSALPSIVPDSLGC